MKKTLISLTDSQMELLSTEAEKLEISKSELLRRIMHMYLDNDNKITKEAIREDKIAKKKLKRNKPVSG
jgi:hypothetical protein